MLFCLPNLPMNLFQTFCKYGKWSNCNPSKVIKFNLHFEIKSLESNWVLISMGKCAEVYRWHYYYRVDTMFGKSRNFSEGLWRNFVRQSKFSHWDVREAQYIFFNTQYCGKITNNCCFFLQGVSLKNSHFSGIFYENRYY